MRRAAAHSRSSRASVLEPYPKRLNRRGSIFSDIALPFEKLELNPFGWITESDSN